MMPKISIPDRDPVDVHIGARVRRRRTMLNLTQAVLAKHLAMSFQAVQKYESGENRVTASNLWRLAKILGVQVDYFFAGMSDEPVPKETAEEEWVALRAVKPLMALPSAVRDELIGFIRGLVRTIGQD
jgi:transcriptional regulator with XRE-family HTH domain